MNIALLADAFPPLKTSAAVQLHDLAEELVVQGHSVTVLLPDSTISTSWVSEKKNNVLILRLKALETKDVNFVRRALSEYLLSFFMYRNLNKSPFKSTKWDALIWYSPSIFFGSLVAKLKKQNGCPAYLILRDIFPEWAVDMGLLKKGMIYRYFKSVEKFQYMQADTIGVQTPSILNYFNDSFPDIEADLEILSNWISVKKSALKSCSIDLRDTSFSTRKIFVYVGNIGIAQGMDILIDLANEFKNDDTVGFVIVGRGTAVKHIKQKAASFELQNCLFFNEIDSSEIPGLLEQCHIGLVALDPRHRNDNIPGKFLSYMKSGLPVLATINPENDLETLIREHKVGEVETDHSLSQLANNARNLLATIEKDPEIKLRCKNLASSHFSPLATASQITSTFKSSD
jgi:glycosyltransferase involved in cell wall biosynthesis